MSKLVGHTPLLEIKYEFKGEERTIYAKAEYFNLTGSVKDRMASHIIDCAIKEGKLTPGQPIIEATSGNTGIAFAAAGASIGSPVEIFMPNWMSTERKDMIKSFGAILHEVTPEEGGFLGSIKMADEYAAKIGGFRPQQFDNEKNIEAHYLTTGPEIISQMEEVGQTIDGFVAGVGTGGTVMGVGKKLKEVNPNCLVFPLEPANSPTLSTGHKVGKHRIQGISDEFIPSIVKLNELDEIIMVDDGDAIIMTQMFAKQLGLGLGISSGGNFLGAVYAQNKYGSDKNIITIFSDDNKKYLSTDLVKEEPVKEEFLSQHIKLKGIRPITCLCDYVGKKTCKHK